MCRIRNETCTGQHRSPKLKRGCLVMFAPSEATTRHVEQRTRFAITMRLSRQCKPLYMRSAFALPTALQSTPLGLRLSCHNELCLSSSR